MADKIQKSIEFKAAKAVGEIDSLIGRLQRTSDMLKRVEATASGISFQKFIPAIDAFVKSFSKLDALPKNIENIRVMAQALNRFKMVAVELNKADFSVSFAKITKGIYSFVDSMNRMENLQKEITAIAELGRGINRFKMVAVELNKADFSVSFAKITQGIYKFSDSIKRMSLLEKTITQIAELGRAINRLVNSSIKLQNMKVSFTSVTQAIYAFVGSILRIKDLDIVIEKIERLANAMDLLVRSSKKFTVVRDFAQFEKAKKKITSLQETIEKLKNEINGFKKTQNSINKIGLAFQNLGKSFNNIAKSLRLANLTYIFHMFKRIGNVVYDLVKVYAEYQENINLATVAYNGLINAQNKLYPFVESMANAFGLNESELIRSVGLFKQMANAMQLTQEQGELLSEGLTKMAYDISSLYNISFDRAMSALQSSLVGKKLPLLLVIIVANLFNCVKVLKEWFAFKKIRREVYMYC